MLNESERRSGSSDSVNTRLQLTLDSFASAMDSCPTKLEYYTDMRKLRSVATVLSYIKGDDGRQALILGSTIFHPQGGGQPADTGVITIESSGLKFIVEDVRSKDGTVFHYGFVDSPSGGETELVEGKEVVLHVDEPRRKLNSRLHSAGHLLDICMKNVGLGHLEPGKGYHFPDGPFVEYKGTIPQSDFQIKRNELEAEANTLISRGGMVSVAVLPYGDAANLCGGSLPDYIPKDSCPRIVKFGDNPGGPCGGTHVDEISEIVGMKVSQIRTKKGTTKIFYHVE